MLDCEDIFWWLQHAVRKDQTKMFNVYYVSMLVVFVHMHRSSWSSAWQLVLHYFSVTKAIQRDSCAARLDAECLRCSIARSFQKNKQEFRQTWEDYQEPWATIYVYYPKFMGKGWKMMEKVGTILYYTILVWCDIGVILTWEDCQDFSPSLRWQCCCCPEVSYELTGTTGGWGDSKMSVKKQPCFPCFRWKDVRLMVWCIPPSQRRSYSRGGEFVYDCHCYFGSYTIDVLASQEANVW